jgi:putative acetyltransferase
MNPLKNCSSSIISKAYSRDRPRLFDVWESAVRATHFFLTESDLQALVTLVRAKLSAFLPIYCVRDTDGDPFAFMGLEASKIEMLCVHARKRGTGIRRLLVEFAIQAFGATSVDVNERNVLAVGFYHRLGFLQVGRSPLDSTGNPFPILHCSLVQSDRVPDGTGEYPGCLA